MLIDDFVNAVREMRQLMAGVNIKQHVTIGMSAHGYPAHGDMKIDFHVTTYFGGNTLTVRGRDPNIVVKEFIRRVTFDTTAQTLQLSGAGDVKKSSAVDEDPPI